MDAKVFVSYSRKDLAFVDGLDAALRERGVETLIDRAEIYAFEDWWRRIQDLIVQADTVIFVLSPDAIASEVCAEEIAFAAVLAKRLAPVVARAVDPAEVPPALSRLNFVQLDDATRFEAGIERLVEALSTDIGWVRRHSEFGELARRWAAAGRPGPQGLLLRSPLLEEAESWIAKRPAGAPPPTEEAQALILTSRRAATRRRQLVTALLAVGLAVASALALLALWQRQVALDNEHLAVAARTAEAEQRRLAERREAQAVEAGNRTLIGQSRFLADLAQRSLEEGDNGSAILFSLEALPDHGGGIARPWLPEAERSLDRALSSLAERSLAIRHPGLLLGFSPDGRWAVSYGGDEQVLTDLAKGSTTRTPTGGDILAFAFSPDGSRLLRCSQNVIQIVELSDLSERAIDPALAPNKLRTCRFEPGGRHLMAIGEGGQVVWSDAATGLPGRRFTLPEGATGLQASEDGTRLASVAQDGVVHVFDAVSGLDVAALGRAGKKVDGLDLSRDGTRLLTTSTSERLVRVWDVVEGRAVAELPTSYASASLSPNGATVLLNGRRRGIAGIGGGFEIRDVATGKQLAIVDPSLRLTSLAFARDGSLVVAGSADGSIHLFEASTGKAHPRLTGHQAQVIAAAISPDGRSILSSAFDTRLVLWTRDARRPSRTLELASDGIGAILPLDGGRRFAAASRDGSLRAWLHGEPQSAATYLHRGPSIAAVAGSKDRLLALRQDGTAILVDSESGAVAVELADVVLPKTSDRSMGDAVFSPEGDRFVVRLAAGPVSMHRASDGGEIWRSEVALDGGGGAFVTPDAKRVIAWSAAGWADILDAKTGERIARIRNTALGLDGRPMPGSGDATLPWSTLVVSPDGRRLVTDGPLQPRVWTLATGETERLLVEHTVSDDRVAMRFGPDLGTVFTVEAGRTVTAWDLAHGTRIRSFVGHTRPITSLRVDPDGRRLLTASEDGSVRLWDIASGIELVSLPGPGPIVDAQWWPNGDIVTTATDGTVRSWPIAKDTRALVDRAKDAVSRCLTPAQRSRAYLDPEPPAWCVTGPGREHDTDPQNWRSRPPYHTPVWRRWYQTRQSNAANRLEDVDHERVPDP